METGVANTTVRTNISLSQRGFRLYHFCELLVRGTRYESIVNLIIITQKPRKKEEKLFLCQIWWETSEKRGLGVLKPVQECMSKNPDRPLALHTFSYANKHSTVYFILD